MADETNTPSGDDLTRLVRYLAGESSPNERKEVEAWVTADATRALLLARLRTSWEETDYLAAFPSNASLRDRILAQTVDAEPTSKASDRSLHLVPRQPNAWSRVGWSIAGIGIAVALILAIVRPRHDSKLQIAPTPAMNEVVTQPGQRASLQLSDGTTIMLAPGSRLQYAKSYDAPTREVALEGEALFTVKHDAAHPFVVRTTRGSLTDLGTRFVVRGFANDVTLRVAVAEGKVRMDSVGALEAGDLGTVSSEGKGTKRRIESLDEYFAWTTGRLVFKETPLSEVVTELARTYAVTFAALPANLRDQRITLQVREGDLALALSDLSRLLNVTFERSGDSVKIVR